MPFAAVKNNLFDYLAEGISFYLITDIWVCQNLMHMCNLAHDIFLAWNLGRRLFCLPAESFGISHESVSYTHLEGLVPNDDSVRLLSHELEDLDYTKLYQAYSAKGRNPAVDPKTMFKILTYAYSQNI